jgi:hypothetical protein
MPAWLTQIFPALTGLVGVLLGVWMTQQGAARVAVQTLEGQRILARDASLRDYRQQQIAPYLEAAKRRFSIWYQVGAHARIGDRAEKYELVKQVADPDFNSLIVTYREVPDDAFREAFHNFIVADTDFDPTKLNELDDFTHDDYASKIAQMRLALVELAEASQHYIFSVESDGIVGHKEARRGAR